MGRISKRRHIPQTTAPKSPGQAERFYRAGIYARLSVKKGESSESIEVQVEIAKRFVEEWNESHSDKIQVVDCYQDLGKTGTSFERDEFQRLMQDVRLGDINCIIVKDLSRFGRNYLEAGNYIEKIFPFLGVRFIAVADGYDTAEKIGETNQMATEIKNLVNDMYAKDFSAKARLSLAQRREEGSYVGGPPPYGYAAVWEGKIRKLVPDDKAAEIVRHIYGKFIETESYKAVADDLNRARVNPPSIYRKSGEMHCPPDMPYKGWDKAYMEVLLKNEVYTGRLVQGKTSISPKKERVWTKEADWKVKEQAHVPLIEEAVFEQAKRIRQKIREKSKNRISEYEIGENVFEDVLYCGVCGRKMTRHSHVREYADGSKRRVEEYFCGNGAATKTNLCPSPNHITKNCLEEILFSLLEAEFSVYLKRKRAYEKKGKEILAERKNELEKELKSVQDKKSVIDRQGSDAYMAYRMGNLTEEALVCERASREQALSELLEREREIQGKILQLGRKEKTFLDAVHALLKLRDKRIFTKELVTALVERISIYPGKRIEVVFAFEDVFRKAGAAE